MINDQFSEQTYNVKEGDNVIIDCMASGQPTPVYSWFKQGSSPIRLKNSSCKLQFYLNINNRHKIKIYLFD